MEFKITKYSPKIKEELPPINRPTRSATRQIIKVITNCKQIILFVITFFFFQNHVESKQPIELINKIDPLVLAAQYEREINRLKMNHNQMLEELHKEIEVLRSKNRGIVLF